MPAIVITMAPGQNEDRVKNSMGKRRHLKDENGDPRPADDDDLKADLIHWLQSETLRQEHDEKQNAITYDPAPEIT